MIVLPTSSPSAVIDMVAVGAGLPSVALPVTVQATLSVVWFITVDPVSLVPTVKVEVVSLNANVDLPAVVVIDVSFMIVDVASLKTVSHFSLSIVMCACPTTAFKSLSLRVNELLPDLASILLPTVNELVPTVALIASPTDNEFSLESV